MPSLEFSLFRSSCRSRISLFLDICHLSLRVGHGPYTACFSIRFRISTSTKTFVVSPKSGTLQGDRPPLCHYHHPLWSYTWRRAHQSFPFKLKPLQQDRPDLEPNKDWQRFLPYACYVPFALFFQDKSQPFRITFVLQSSPAFLFSDADWLILLYCSMVLESMKMAPFVVGYAGFGLFLGGWAFATAAVLILLLNQIVYTSSRGSLLHWLPCVDFEIDGGIRNNTSQKGGRSLNVLFFPHSIVYYDIYIYITAPSKSY